MYKLIKNINETSPLLKDIEQAVLISLDTETTGLDPYTNRLTLVQIKVNGTTYIIDFRTFGRENLAYIIKKLDEKNVPIIAHNSKFDWKFIYHNTGVKIFNFYDTMLAEIMLSMGIGDIFYSLKDLVKKYSLVELSKEERNEFIDNPDIELTEQVLIYSALDVEYLEDIYKSQVQLLERQGLKFAADFIEMPVISATAEMEYFGIKIDPEIWKPLETESKEKAEATANKIHETLLDACIEKLKPKTALELFEKLEISKEISTKKNRELYSQLYDQTIMRTLLKDKLNLNSTAQMLAVLTKVYEVKDDRGKFIESTNEKIINKFIDKYPIISDLLTYRGFMKGATSFGSGYLERVNPVTGRIHTEFHQLGARTSRYSSRNPDMQNVKRESEYREGFISEEGYSLVCSDFSQQELRCIAEVSQDPALKDMFERHIDPHTYTASGLFNIPFEQIAKSSPERAKAKNVNFGVSYGISAWGLHRQFDIPLEEGEKHLKKYWEIYKGYKSFIDAVTPLIYKNMYSKTLTGRKRYFENRKVFDGPKDHEKYLAQLKREGVNVIIQGTCAEITKLSLQYVQRRNPFGDKLRLLLQVHDELVCEAADEIKDQAKEFVKDCMLDAEKYFIKTIECEVDCKVDKHWVH